MHDPRLDPGFAIAYQCEPTPGRHSISSFMYTDLYSVKKTFPRAKQMIADKSISGGMIPKMECALEALAPGIQKVQMINGKRRHALLLELFTDSGIGTEVIP